MNQASLTGESLPVSKRPGSPVFAGAVVEEGECIVCVEKAVGSGRYDRVVRMIEESEKLKSTAEDKASRMADKLVPYTLGGTAATYLLTRNMTKTFPSRAGAFWSPLPRRTPSYSIRPAR